MPTTLTFRPQGSVQTFTVPPGVFSFDFDMKSPQGGSVFPSVPAGASGGGGFGTHVTGTMPCAPGQTWAVYTGLSGGSPALHGGAAGTGGWGYCRGAPGGSGGSSTSSFPTGGAGGGGASALAFTDPTTHALSAYIVGGGGGAGSDPSSYGANGGNAGGTTGQAGGDGTGTGHGGGGGGGTASAGGAPGSGAGSPGAGSATVGGAGGIVGGGGLAAGGGGGGGGKFGGGGGGGGSAPADTSGAGGGGSTGSVGTITPTGITATTGAVTGDGLVTVTYNQPPNTPVLTSPATNTNIDYTTATVFIERFSDPDPTDVQSKADMQWSADNGATWNLESAFWPDSNGTASTAANFWLTYAGQVVEWQARTYDSVGAVSPWSPSSFFTPVPHPADPTLSPVVLNSFTPPVTITSSETMVTVQVQVWSDNTGVPGVLLADTGTIPITPAATTYTGPTPSYEFVNGTAYHVLVRYAHDVGAWSVWVDSGAITADIAGPVPPLIDCEYHPLSPDDDLSGCVVITWTSPTPSDPALAVITTDLTRTGPDGVAVRLATLGAPAGFYIDRIPPGSSAGLEVDYRVIGYAASGAFASSE